MINLACAVLTLRETVKANRYLKVFLVGRIFSLTSILAIVQELMALDFVQIRWQQIRMAEASQVLESENVALKKEVQELRNRKVEPVVVAAPPVKVGVSSNEVHKYCVKLKSVAMCTQSDLLKLKLMFAQEMGVVMNQKMLLEKSFENMVSLLEIKEAQYEGVAYERDQLKEELSIAKEALDAERSNVDSELHKVRQQFRKAREQIIEAESVRQNLINEQLTATENYNLLKASKNEVEYNYSVSVCSCFVVGFLF
jgi:hypothetical protein